MTRPFHPSELSGADGGEPTSAELGEALATARAIETQLAAADVHPSTEFAARVMAAIADEPKPQPAVAAGVALRQGRIGTLFAALADSWRVAFSGGRPLAVRAQAAAFVLVAILAAGSLGGIGLVGALDVLAPNRSPSPPPTQAAPVTPSPRLGPTETSQPTDTTEPTETPDASETPEPSETREPARTARPGKTDHPNETPEPTETDDHGDGSGGGGQGGDGSGATIHWRRLAHTAPDGRAEALRSTGDRRHRLAAPSPGLGRSPIRGGRPGGRDRRGGRGARPEVQLVGRVGEDPAGDATLLALARSGIGHVAMLRDPAHSTAVLAPGSDRGRRPGRPRRRRGNGRGNEPGRPGLVRRGPQPSIATTSSWRCATWAVHRVIVVAEPLDQAALDVVSEATAYAGARLVLLVADDAVPSPAPGGAIVLGAPPDDPDGVFARTVGEFAAALDAGTDPATALASAVTALGWEPAEA